jgi:hypothetical protein
MYKHPGSFSLRKPYTNPNQFNFDQVIETSSHAINGTCLYTAESPEFSRVQTLPNSLWEKTKSMAAFVQTLHYVRFTQF